MVSCLENTEYSRPGDIGYDDLFSLLTGATLAVARVAGHDACVVINQPSI